MIRSADESDAVAIANILAISWKTAFMDIVDQNYSNSISADKYIKLFTANIKENKEMIYVNDENKVNGFISGVISNEKYDCQIIGLYLLPEKQRKGVGKELVNKMITYFKEKRKKNVIIWTINGAKNNGFYEHIGFKKAEYKELKIGEKIYPGVGFSKVI